MVNKLSIRLIFFIILDMIFLVNQKRKIQILALKIECFPTLVLRTFLQKEIHKV